MQQTTLIDDDSEFIIDNQLQQFNPTKNTQSNNEDLSQVLNPLTTKVQNFFNEKLISHKRRKLIDDKKDNDHLSNSRAAQRSKSRAAKRGSKSMSSRGSLVSSEDHILNQQPIIDLNNKNELNYTNIKDHNRYSATSSQQNAQNVILEQDHEESQTCLDINSNVNYQQNQHLKKMPTILTKSWEDAIHNTAHDYVSGLLMNNHHQQVMGSEAGQDTNNNNIADNSQKSQFKRGPTLFISKRKSSVDSQDLNDKEEEINQQEQNYNLLKQKNTLQIDDQDENIIKGQEVEDLKSAKILKQTTIKESQVEDMVGIQQQLQTSTLLNNNQVQINEEEHLKLLKDQEEMSLKVIDTIENVLIREQLQECSEKIENKLTNKLVKHSLLKVEFRVVKEILRDSCQQEQQIIDDKIVQNTFDILMDQINDKMIEDQVNVFYQDMETKISDNLNNKLFDNVIQTLIDEQVQKMERKTQKLLQIKELTDKQEIERKKIILEENMKIEEEKLKVQQDLELIQLEKARLQEEQEKIQQERQRFIGEQKQIEEDNRLKLLQEQERLKQLEQQLINKQHLIQTEIVDEIEDQDKSKSILDNISQYDNLNEPSFINSNSQQILDKNSKQLQNTMTISKTLQKDISLNLYEESLSKLKNDQSMVKSGMLINSKSEIEQSQALLDPFEQLAEQGVQQISKEIFDELFIWNVDELKQEMYTQFLENITDKAENKLINSMIKTASHQLENKDINKLANQAVDQCEDVMIKRLTELYILIEEQKQIDIDRKTHKLQNILKSSNAGDMPKIKVIKKKNFKKVETSQTQQNSPRPTEDGMNRMKTAIDLSKKPTQIKDMKISDLLDLEFFEKCFFGKKLVVKDQVVFRVYANELVELIKTNLSKDLRKKYKLFKDQKRQQTKTSKSKQKNNKSKSPTTRVFDQSVELQGYKMLANFRSTKTPDPQPRNGSNTFEVTNNKTQDNIVNIQLPQQISKFKNSKRSSQQTGNDYTNELYRDFTPKINFQPELNNLSINQQISNDSPQVTQGLRTLLADGVYFSTTTLNPDQTPSNNTMLQAQDEQSKSIRARKKRQPSQIKINNLEGENSSRRQSKSQNVTPPKNAQLKVYQNLENQMKDIMKLKSSAIKQIRTKRRIINNSERQSPALSPNVSNQDINYIQYQNSGNNFQVTPILMDIVQHSITPMTINAKKQQFNQYNQNLMNSTINSNRLSQLQLEDYMSIDFARQTADSKAYRIKNGKSKQQQIRAHTPLSPNVNNFASDSQSIQSNNININGSDIQEDYRQYKKLNEKEIMAISTPKKRINQIIESARKYIRVGDEIGKPQNISFAGQIKNQRDMSNHKKYQRPLSNLKHQDIKNMNINKLEPFLQEFMSQNQLQKLTNQFKQATKIKSKSKLKKVGGDMTITIDNDLIQNQQQNNSRMNRTFYSQNNSPQNTIMSYGQKSYVGNNFLNNTTMPEQYQDIKKNLMGQKKIITMHEKIKH